MNQEKREMQGFIKISRYAGMRRDLAQAGGGNTSVKLDDREMLVKSSGFQLADVNEKAGYSRVDYRMIVSYFEEKNMGAAGQDAEILTEERGKELLAQAHIEGGRASIETFLHAVTGKYTLHSHPTLVNILAARCEGMEELRRLFPEAVFVPYKKPGAALAESYYMEYQKHVSEGSRSEIIFLENHGLVVSGGDADGVIERTEEVLYLIERYLCESLHNDLLCKRLSGEAYRGATKIWEVLLKVPPLQDKIVYTCENKFLSWEIIGESLLAKKAWKHVFCPDCVVYGSKKMLYLAEEFEPQDIESFMEKDGMPALICYGRQVYIMAESVRKAQEIENVMSFSAQVQMANAECGINYLTDGQQDELLNWDSEKYRREMK